MKIRIGTLGNETEFNKVNVGKQHHHIMTRHEMLAGNIKTQEAVETYKEFSITFVCLSAVELATLDTIYSQSGSVNLQLETEDFLIDHTVKCLTPLDSWLSGAYPGCYEATLSCVEVV
jgi:hypothetical protein